MYLTETRSLNTIANGCIPKLTSDFIPNRSARSTPAGVIIEEIISQTSTQSGLSLPRCNHALASSPGGFAWTPSRNKNQVQESKGRAST